MRSACSIVEGKNLSTAHLKKLLTLQGWIQEGGGRGEVKRVMTPLFSIRVVNSILSLHLIRDLLLVDAPCLSFLARIPPPFPIFLHLPLRGTFEYVMVPYQTAYVTLTRDENSTCEICVCIYNQPVNTLHPYTIHPTHYTTPLE